MNPQLAKTAIEQFLKTIAAAGLSDETPATASHAHAQTQTQPSSLPDFHSATAAMNAPVPTAAQNAATRVAVRRPDGSTTTIPAIHLNAAIQHGYKPITQ